MPPQKAKSALLAKYGKALEQAHHAVKDNETEFSKFGDLPAGIENGIAKLDSVKFDQFKNGDLKNEWYFMAQAVVVLPKEVNGIPVENLQTRIGPEPLCDTPSRSRKTTQEHVDWIYNELRKLGVDTKDLELADLEATCEALSEAAPYIRFRTWASKPNKDYPDPKTNHSWNGTVEYTPEEDDGAVDDETGGEEPAEEEAPPPAKKPPAKAPSRPATAPAKTPTDGKPNAPKPGGKAPPKPADDVDKFDEQAPEAEEAPDEGPALEALAEAADGGDEDAQTALGEMATEAGISEQQIVKAKDYAALVKLIQDATGEAGEETTEEEEEGEEAATEFTPEKDMVVYHRPKGGKKPVECEVVAVFAKKRTASLKNLDNPKLIYKDVSWDAMAETEDGLS